MQKKWFFKFKRVVFWMSPAGGTFSSFAGSHPKAFHQLFCPQLWELATVFEWSCPGIGPERGKGTAGIDWCIITLPNFLHLLLFSSPCLPPANVETLGHPWTNLAFWDLITQHWKGGSRNCPKAYDSLCMLVVFSVSASRNPVTC